MKRGLPLGALMLVALAIVLGGAPAPHAQVSRTRPRVPYPDLKKGIPRLTRGGADKLSPELRILVEQYSTGRGDSARADSFRYSPARLESMFGISPGERNPRLDLAIKVSPSFVIRTLKERGAKVHLRMGDTVHANVYLLSVEQIAENPDVLAVSALTSPRVPPTPKSRAMATPPLPPNTTLPGTAPARAPRRRDNEFAKGGLTGRGVVVGVVDTGIDWHHADFINPDGTSRILYLWDMFDDSYQASGGGIGSAPPTLTSGGDPLPGTVYTKAQLDAALKGSGEVNSTDEFGHGTAVAGTAAGNGRATANGVPAGTYVGVAPEADLIIVKAARCGRFNSKPYLGTVWIAQTARALGRPFVINHSYGGHYTAHDGADEEEQVMNNLVGQGKSGAAITVSAGNEGDLNFHAGGRFGARRPGQADILGTSFQVTVLPNGDNASSQMDAYFNAADDWGLVIYGSGTFLTSASGGQQLLYVYKESGQVEAQITEDGAIRAELTPYAKSLLDKVQLAPGGAGTDQLTLMLPPGSYEVQGFGATDRVRDGRFNLYLPDEGAAGFTVGGDKKLQVGSPGNAAGVITVGAYNFRDSWTSLAGGETVYNLELGRISTYSSQGGLHRGGVFKPELAAPATYTISPLSSAAGPGGTGCGRRHMGLREADITRDGFHLAWEGTSASAPFTAGVVALMLQKNPTLDGEQIKRILTRTATRGGLIGATPNTEWGYGKINPALALTHTPAAPARHPHALRPKRRSPHA
jgi:subtilisin family serine protease